VPAAYEELDRLVARLHEQGITAATFEWYVVGVERRPVARPRAQWV
jgi:hypothetical protein